MWIKIRTMDGTKNFQVDGLSKLTKIEELRKRLEDDLEVPPSRQRLFFAGRQLEDGSSLFDYNVGLNSLIQVMIRPVLGEVKDNIENSSESDEKVDREKDESFVETRALKTDCDPDIDKHETKPNVAFRWKVNDYVDGKDLTMGAWFEATVQKVDVDENGDARYHVTYDDYDENEISQLTEKDIRPRARHLIPFDNLQKGMVVMANYNCDEPKERGFWYDVKVTRKSGKRSAGKVYGKLVMWKDGEVGEECCIQFVDEIFRIESSSNNIYASEQQAPEKRKVKPDCSTCKDDPKMNCTDCSCHTCGVKDDPEKTLLCDECDQAYHMRCLDPPMETLPGDDDWYCPMCKNDDSNVIIAGEKQRKSQKKAKMASANPKEGGRDWGKGMACVGRTKICTIVPPNHFGPVPGVPVGSCWKFRVQASEAGVHRPHVSGMHGRDSEGAYSIVLAGGYEDDADDGDEFTYTGSGGRDLSGNKRTAEQSFDQTLTRANKALARNCDCPVSEKGGEAKNWKDGKPIRVIRSYKFAKHSEYAPEEGVRYDGIYKVVKYWPDKGLSGFIVWRYCLRRDDMAPAPWTEDGKKKIAELALEIVYPEGYLEAQSKKEAEKDAIKSKKKGKRKRKSENSEEEGSSEENESNNATPKKIKVEYSVSNDHISLINQDIPNKSIWMKIIENPQNHATFLQDIEDNFSCICCQELVFCPVTVACGHNTCKSCLIRAFKAGVFSCPSCRFALDKDFAMDVNESLNAILKELFPGYEAGR